MWYLKPWQNLFKTLWVYLSTRGALGERASYTRRISSLPSSVLAGGASFGLFLAFPFVYSVWWFWSLAFIGLLTSEYKITESSFLAKFPLLTKLENFDFKCKNELIFGVCNRQILKTIIMKNIKWWFKFYYFHIPLVIKFD